MKPKLNLQPDCTKKGTCGSRDFAKDFDKEKDCKKCKYLRKVSLVDINKGICAGIGV